MKPILLDEDVIPVSEFKANTAKWIERIRETGRPVLLTQNGRSAAVVMNPAAYDADHYRRRLVEKIEEGLDDVRNGRVSTTEEVLRRAKKAITGARK